MTPGGEPVTELDPRYGEEGVSPVSWAEAERALGTAELSWLSTVRPEGQPHVTPLITVWHDGAVWITTGPEEQKARNMAANPHVAVTTGCNALHEGLDLVVEGTAVRETDDARLRRVAAAFEDKYGEEWHFDVDGGTFSHGPGTAHVFEVAPVRAYGFGKAPYSHTRWRF
jgi:nitroimidazol reductase NimA-like FMN-containing flavoprotein (pyridoxamine 5'-phosphate oxidase superfamily)